jgi:tRNA-dihydrouridine synthase
MAGITHSGFRRLLADFGGYGALTTEMLSASAFLKEDLGASPFTRRREAEGTVIYQFGISGEEDLDLLQERAAGFGCAVLDLNLGCPAPRIQQEAYGVALFRDFPRLRSVLERLRKGFDGPLTVKCRLGDDEGNWREGFLERLRLFEDLGVSALTVHPRFSFEKLKRRARWHEFPWIGAHTRLPLVGNGDICAPADLERNPGCFAPLSGLMLGRIAVMRPWIFREFAGLPPLPIDHLEVWDRFYRYTLEDMAPERAFGRLMDFSYYFAKNFLFGHEMYKSLQKASRVEEIRGAALRFLESRPTLTGSRGLPFT